MEQDNEQPNAGEGEEQERGGERQGAARAIVVERIGTLRQDV